jgi:hypothetical protein
MDQPERMTLGRFWQGIKDKSINFIDENTMRHACQFGILNEVYALMRGNNLFFQGKLRAQLTANLMIMTLGMPIKTGIDPASKYQIERMKLFKKWRTIFHTRTRKSAKKLERKQAWRAYESN